jgi:hypothetical protein
MLLGQLHFRLLPMGGTGIADPFHQFLVDLTYPRRT